MRARIGGLVGPVARTHVDLAPSTAMCARILRREAERLGYKSHLHDLRRRRRQAAGQALPGRAQPRRQALHARRRWRAPAQRRQEPAAGPGAIPRADRRALSRRPRPTSTSSTRSAHAEMNAMDFDDLLMKTVKLLERYPDRLAHYQQRVPLRLVDEYQDTNHAQYRIANLLAGEHGNLAVVGDDDQSIYSWRGADIRNILEFERDYPDAKVIRLEQNYRSTQPHPRRRQRGGHQQPQAQGQEPVDRARRGRARRRSSRSTTSTPRRSSWPARCSKLLTRAEAQGRRARLPRPTTSPCSIAPTPRSRVLEEQFGRYAIAYQVIGGPTLLRARRDPRRARLPHDPRQPRRRAAPAAHRQRAASRGIGADQPCSACRRDAADASARPLWNAIARRRRRARHDARRASGLLEQFARRGEGLQAEASGRARRWPRWCARVLDESGYSAALTAPGHARGRGSPREPRGVRRRARPSTTSAPRSPALDGFLQEISLYATSTPMADTSELITFMTLHNAKGLEFPVVFITGHGGGRVPAPALSRRAEPGRGAPPGLRRHHAGDGPALPAARPGAQALGRQPRTACPRGFWPRSPPTWSRSSASADRPTPLGPVGGGWSGGGAGAGAAASAAASAAARAATTTGRRSGASATTTASGVRASASPGLEKKLDETVVEQFFAPGDRVLHATLGEGTVQAAEQGGIIVRALRERRLASGA